MSERWPWAYTGRPSSLSNLIKTRNFDTEAFRRRRFLRALEG